MRAPTIPFLTDRRIQGLFGVKVGVRYERVGFFGKLRPGFLNFHNRVAIHGDYDPHPAEGVLQPLSARLKDFRFVLLRNCGHTPWLEQQARDSFYEAIRRELA